MAISPPPDDFFVADATAGLKDLQMGRIIGDIGIDAGRNPRQQIGADEKFQLLVAGVRCREHDPQPVDPRDDVRRLARDFLPLGCKEHLVSLTLEQRHAELLFENLYGVGDILPAREAALGRLGIA